MVATETATNCAHHWMIETANGTQSSGTCKHCGVNQKFFNSYDCKDFNGKRIRKPQLVTYAQRVWKIKNYGFDGILDR